jgi:hypothetical protein
LSYSLKTPTEVIPFSLQHLNTLMAISPLLQHINLLIGLGKFTGPLNKGIIPDSWSFAVAAMTILEGPLLETTEDLA